MTSKTSKKSCALVPLNTFNSHDTVPTYHLFKGKAFSILIDESTDTSCKKLLAVLVRHWDTRSRKVIDDLLGLVEVVGTTGEELFQAVQGTYLMVQRYLPT